MPVHVAVVDTETTGVDTKVCKLVELAMYSEYTSFETLINPGCDIPPETSAVHHICNEDVVDAIDEPTAIYALCEQLIYAGVTVLAAHNADFDRTILERLGIPQLDWICTYKCALWVWPDAPSHKNEALCYWLNIGDNGRRFSQGSHSALHDAKRTYLLLNELLKITNLEQLKTWTKQPKNITKLAFGKHVGKTWAEIDSGYLNWMVNQADFDPDYKFHAKEELARRRR